MSAPNAGSTSPTGALGEVRAQATRPANAQCSPFAWSGAVVPCPPIANPDGVKCAISCGSAVPPS